MHYKNVTLRKPHLGTFAQSRGRDRAAFEAELRALEMGGAAEVDPDLEYFKTPAANAVEFIAGSSFMDAESIYSHYGAYKLVRDYFQLLCPDCATPDMHATHRVTAHGNVNKSRWEYEGEPLLRWNEAYSDNQCPKCGKTRAELLDAGLLRWITHGVGIIGQRGGKSYTLGQMGVYQEHFLLTRAFKYGSIATYLNLPKSATFVSTCLAASEEQAEKTIWYYYTVHRRNSPWFQKIVPWIKKRAKSQIVPMGMKPWEYVENAQSIEYGEFNWILNSLNSNAATGRGGTRLWVLMDEISHFKDTASEFGAEENYEAMQNSLATTRGQAARLGLPSWIGSIFAISSPRSLEDYGYRLMVTAAEDPHRFALHRAAWEFNPEFPSPDCPALVSSRLSNPAKFMTNFGARPPSSAQPIYPDFDSWRGRVEHIDHRPILEPHVTIEMANNGVAWCMAEIDESQLVALRDEPMPASGFVIACDAGQKFDCFAIAIGHAANTPEGRTTIVDALFRIVPGEGEEVLFASVEAFIMKLAEYLPIARVRFDRWQSVQIVQNLQRQLGQKNVDVEQETMPDSAIIRLFREGAEGLIWMLPGDRGLETKLRPAEQDAQTVVWHELKNLQWDPKNGKIFNPKKGKVRGENSDDVARTLAYLHQEVQELEYIERDDTSKESLRKRAAAFTAQARTMGFGGFMPSAGGVANGGNGGVGGSGGGLGGLGGGGVGGMSGGATGSRQQNTQLALSGGGRSYITPGMQVSQFAQQGLIANVAHAAQQRANVRKDGRYTAPEGHRTSGPLTPPRIGGFFSTTGNKTPQR